MPGFSFAPLSGYRRVRCHDIRFAAVRIRQPLLAAIQGNGGLPARNNPGAPGLDSTPQSTRYPARRAPNSQAASV